MSPKSSPDVNIGQNRDGFTIIRQTGKGAVTWWASETMAREAVEKRVLDNPVMVMPKLSHEHLDPGRAHIIMAERENAAKVQQFLAKSASRRRPEVVVARPAAEGQTLQGLIRRNDFRQCLEFERVVFSAPESMAAKVTELDRSDRIDASAGQVQGSTQPAPAAPGTDVFDRTVAGKAPDHAEPFSHETAVGPFAGPIEPDPHPLRTQLIVTDAEARKSCDAGTASSEVHTEKRSAFADQSAGSQLEPHPTQRSKTAEIEALIEAMTSAVAKSDRPVSDVLAEFRSTSIDGPASGPDMSKEPSSASAAHEVDPGPGGRPDGQRSATDVPASPVIVRPVADCGEGHQDTARGPDEIEGSVEQGQASEDADQMDIDPNQVDLNNAEPVPIAPNDSTDPNEAAAKEVTQISEQSRQQETSSLAARAAGFTPSDDAVLTEADPPPLCDPEDDGNLSLTPEELMATASEFDVPPLPPALHGLPVYPYRTRAPSKLAEKIAGRMRKDNRLFVFGGRLCFVESERAISKIDGHAYKKATLAQADWQSLRSLIEVHVTFARYVRARKVWTYSTQDRPFYESLISRRNGWFNSISGTVSHPVLNDGEVLTGHHGYHHPTGLWISGNELPIERFDCPNKAMELLRYWLEPFPFVDEDDFVRALLIPATLLVSRTMIGGKMPIYLITSNGQDTGKTYLANTLVAVITGDEIDARTFPEDEREAEKKLTSALLADPDALLWDNVPSSLRLHSPLLCRYSTARGLNDRILGGNDEASLPSTALQILTGIDVRAVRDTASRTVTIRQYQTDEPHPRLEGVEKWTQENRGRIIAALACLLSQPAPSGHVKSRFNTWTKVAAAPIAFATGNTRFLDEMTAVHSATGGPALDDLIAAMARHPEAIIARNQDPGDRTGFAAGEMIAQFEEELLGLLAPKPGDQMPKQAGLPRRLAKYCNLASGDFWLRSNAQARSDNRERTTRFYLQRRKEEPE